MHLQHWLFGAQPKFILRPPSRVSKRSGQNLLLNCKVSAEASISWRRVGGAWVEDRMKVKNGTLEIFFPDTIGFRILHL